MPVANYSQYVADLRELVVELHTAPDVFRTFDVALECNFGKGIITYARNKAKGVITENHMLVDKTGRSSISAQVAYDAAFGFMDGGFYVAVSANKGSSTSVAGKMALLVPTANEYPYMAAILTYRKTGQPETKRMRMVFMALNNGKREFLRTF